MKIWWAQKGPFININFAKVDVYLWGGGGGINFVKVDGYMGGGGRINFAKVDIFIPQKGEVGGMGVEVELRKGQQVP